MLTFLFASVLCQTNVTEPINNQNITEPAKDMNVTEPAIIVNVTQPTKPDNNTAAPTTTPVIITKFSLDLRHESSTISSIHITWNAAIPEWVTVEKYQIKTQKIGSESITLSPGLEKDTNEYIVENLVSNSDYEVCIMASIINNTVPVETTTCRDFFTIPIMRYDSMYVLGAAIALFVMLILIGCVTWRCAVYSAAKREEDLKKPNGIQKKPVSTRDEDAPFLTPPTSRPQDTRKVFRPNVA